MSGKRRSSALSGPLYRRAAWAIRAVLAVALVWELLTLDPVGVLSMAFFIALSFAYLLRDEKLPNVFDALVALSALLNAFGFVFDLFDGPVLYDEVAHAVTIFALTLAFFFLFYRGAVPGGRALAMGTAVFTFGVTSRTTSNAVELPETMTGIEYRQQAAYEEVRAEIERGLKDSDLNVPVYDGFLPHAADNGRVRRAERG